MLQSLLKFLRKNITLCLVFCFTILCFTSSYTVISAEAQSASNASPLGSIKRYKNLLNYVKEIDEARNYYARAKKNHERAQKIIRKDDEEKKLLTELQAAAEAALDYTYPSAPNWSTYITDLKAFKLSERQELVKPPDGLHMLQEYIITTKSISEDLFEVTRSWRTATKSVGELKDQFKLLMVLPVNEVTHIFTEAHFDLELYIEPEFASTLNAYENADRKFLKQSITYKTNELQRLTRAHEALFSIKIKCEAEYNSISEIITDAREEMEVAGQVYLDGLDKLAKDEKKLKGLEKNIQAALNAPAKITSLKSQIHTVELRIFENTAKSNAPYSTCPQGNTIQDCTSDGHAVYRRRWVNGMNEALARNRKLKPRLKKLKSTLKKQEKLAEKLSLYQTEAKDLKVILEYDKLKNEEDKIVFEDLKLFAKGLVEYYADDIGYLQKTMLDIEDYQALLARTKNSVINFQHIYEKPLSYDIFKPRPQSKQN